MTSAVKDFIPQRVDKVLWDIGCCCLCPATDRYVQWLGPVTSPSGHGDLHACGECIRALDRKVRRQNHERDNAPAK